MDAVDNSRLLELLALSLAKRAIPLKEICSEYELSDEICWAIRDAMQVVGILKSGQVVITGAEMYEIVGADARPTPLSCWTNHQVARTIENYRNISHQCVTSF
jgi:hypothetical protein